ncbi:hypothetical protein L596_014031 [Steinernema carpocapsae]|uniref:Uncharacterized protein n=1 Tax=Steinernema carpocapsae TaxID=34508 RepID=A0A4V6A2N8_STECR|nr:hypothetical protein L596_014031 [Steinernema carpocapsae]
MRDRTRNRSSLKNPKRAVAPGARGNPNASVASSSSSAGSRSPCGTRRKTRRSTRCAGRGCAARTRTTLWTNPSIRCPRRPPQRTASTSWPPRTSSPCHGPARTSRDQPDPSIFRSSNPRYPSTSAPANLSSTIIFPIGATSKRTGATTVSSGNGRHNKSIQLLETVYGIAQQTSI